jgi:hypothetical protein
LRLQFEYLGGSILGLVIFTWMRATRGKQFSSDMLIALALSTLGGLAWILASAAWWKGRWRTASFASALGLLLLFLDQFFDID